MINVTKPYLPEFEKYVSYLEGIWERRWLTNSGPLVVQLEEKLKKFLKVKHLFFVTNGTIALQIALKALELKGEIITTPFSYVATTSSIVWEGCKPIFADINPKTLCIDPDEIRKKISLDTSGILGVHVYGNPCDYLEIESIAKKSNLKVIYDAAHAFNIRVSDEHAIDRSILCYGDISTLSFHATKVFHSIEGGAIITENDELAHRISYLRNFGHNGPEDFYGEGINGKSSEFQAAMGLCILEEYLNLEEQRLNISRRYDVLFADILNQPNCEILAKPKAQGVANHNYGYYPVIFESEEMLLQVREKLNLYQIFPRRYFYPSLNTLPYVSKQS